MNNAVPESSTTINRVAAGSKPLPEPLPGIEGFYLLTAAGEIGRYREDGTFAAEPELGHKLAGKIEALLRQYRDGDPKGLVLALVTPKTPDQPWAGASLTFGDHVLREILRTSDDSSAALTRFQRRNKTKSVSRGMELLLEEKKPAQPQLSRYCPVLFVPEVNGETLRERYNVGALDTRNAFEVIDLMAPCSPGEQRDPVLAEMILEMARNKVAPGARNAPELMLVENLEAAPGRMRQDWSRDVVDPQATPWEHVPEDRNTSFSDGDPVTYWLLARFAPFNELNDLQRQFIARGHLVTRKHAGTTLIERGSREDMTIYLVDGTLELEAFDGKKMSISGGTRRAHLPISQLRPHAYTVKAATDASVIVVSQEMVRQVTRITTTYNSRPGIEVTEAESLPDAVLKHLPSASVAHG